MIRNKRKISHSLLKDWVFIKKELHGYWWKRSTLKSDVPSFQYGIDICSVTAVIKV